jgi:hypothetical protein
VILPWLSVDPLDRFRGGFLGIWEICIDYIDVIIPVGKWVITPVIIRVDSLDWFKGKFTGKHGFYH